jgi:hypothetical protein
LTTAALDYGDALALAEKVSRFKEWYGALSQDQAYELAYDAIVSSLSHGATGDDPVKYLTAVARNTIRRYLWARADEYSDVPRDTTGTGFYRFWLGLRGSQPDPAPDIIERLGLWQTLEALSDRERGDLAALAATLDVATAAAARGAELNAMHKRLERARQAFCQHWYAPDRPPIKRRKVYNEGARARPRLGQQHQPGEGVYFNRKAGKWMARGHDGKRRVYLGLRNTREEAQELVDEFYAEREARAKLQLLFDWRKS